MNKEDTLCNNNLQVKFNLNLLKKKLKSLKVKDEEVFNLINTSLETLRIMKKQGQAMENRLSDYFNAITGLSFVRVRKKSK